MRKSNNLGKKQKLKTNRVCMFAICIDFKNYYSRKKMFCNFVCSISKFCFIIFLKINFNIFLIVCSVLLCCFWFVICNFFEFVVVVSIFDQFKINWARALIHFNVCVACVRSKQLRKENKKRKDVNDGLFGQQFVIF